MCTYIKNGVVNMLWDANAFFESRDGGFVAACQLYEGCNGNIVVCFKDSKAFILSDPENEGCSIDLENMYEIVSEAFREELDIEDCFVDEYVDVYDGIDLNETALEYYGLSEEDGDDIVKRFKDLKSYWQYEEISCNPF